MCDFLLQKKNILISARLNMISINPVAPTKMKKILTRIVATEKVGISDQQIDVIVQQHDGDIRHAINALQFFGTDHDLTIASEKLAKAIKKNSSASSSASKMSLQVIGDNFKEKSKKTSKKVSNENNNFVDEELNHLLNSTKDSPLSLFHGLGKFLYGKSMCLKMFFFFLLNSFN